MDPVGIKHPELFLQVSNGAVENSRAGAISDLLRFAESRSKRAPAGSTRPKAKVQGRFRGRARYALYLRTFQLDRREIDWVHAEFNEAEVYSLPGLNHDCEEHSGLTRLGSRQNARRMDRDGAQRRVPRAQRVAGHLQLAYQPKPVFSRT